MKKNNAMAGFVFIIMFALAFITCDPIEGSIEDVLERAGGSTSYTVSFDSAGGDAVAVKTAAHGGKVQKPTDPKKTFALVEGLYLGSDPENYVLEGWYNGTKKWNFDSDVVTENITLIAHWEAPSKVNDNDLPIGANIVLKALGYTNGKTGSYTMVVGGNYSVGLQSLITSGLKLTIIGLNKDNEWKISPSSGSNYLFAVSAGELCLGNNITLAGYSPSSSYALIQVNSGAVLTMKGTSKITGNTSTNNGGGVYISGGIFNMSGGNIINNTAPEGGGVCNAGTFNMTGGNITNNHAVNGNGVYTSGTFKMSGGSITGNTTTNTGSELGDAWGGGVFIAPNGAFIMSNGTISDNKVIARYPEGGGVYVNGSSGNNGSFVMKGGTISDNKTVGMYGRGGGVFVNIYDCTFILDGGIISGNSSGDGGGIYAQSFIPFVMHKGSITGNTANYGAGMMIVRDSVMNGGDITGNIALDDGEYEGCGGGVYITASTFSPKLTINGGTISSNIAANGGGVYIGRGSLTMNGGSISNHSDSDAVHLGSYRASFTMNKGEITGNNGGFGVFVGTGNFYMNGGVISNNRGGVYVPREEGRYGYFEMTNGTIKNNTTDDNGAGVHVSGGSFIMEGGTISDNKVTVYDKGGGGVYVKSIEYEGVFYGAFTMSGGTISGNSGNWGGGVHVSGGIFTMTGGAIQKNAAPTMYTGSQNGTKSGRGGGVYLKDNGSFRMAGGTVYGSTASGGLSNTASYGAALYVAGGTAEYGTYKDETWNKAGDISDTDNTIKVVNGKLQ